MKTYLLKENPFGLIKTIIIQLLLFKILLNPTFDYIGYITITAFPILIFVLPIFFIVLATMIKTTYIDKEKGFKTHLINLKNQFMNIYSYAIFGYFLIYIALIITVALMIISFAFALHFLTTVMLIKSFAILIYGFSLVVLSIIYMLVGKLYGHKFSMKIVNKHKKSIYVLSFFALGLFVLSYVNHSMLVTLLLFIFVQFTLFKIVTDIADFKNG